MADEHAKRRPTGSVFDLLMKMKRADALKQFDSFKYASENAYPNYYYYYTIVLKKCKQNLNFYIDFFKIAILLKKSV